MTSVNIPNISENEWLEVLKPYQRVQVDAILQGASAKEAAKKWFESQGAVHTQRFGGDKGNQNVFFDAFVLEMAKFLCGDPAYEDYRKALVGPSHVSKQVFISTVSTAIAVTLGVIPALLTPAIVLLVCSIGTAGLNAWCAVQMPEGVSSADQAKLVDETTPANSQ